MHSSICKEKNSQLNSAERNNLVACNVYFLLTNYSKTKILILCRFLEIIFAEILKNEFNVSLFMNFTKD